MTNKLNRRILLQGLGGAAVAAPFLSSVSERAAKAQDVPAGGPPKRLIVLFTHYGCLTNRWFPTKAHGALTAADYESTTLKHLAPFAPKLLMPRGIRAMNEWSFGRTHGQNNDPHTQVMGSYFTCYPVTPEDDKFGAKATGKSLDHYCAEQVNPNGAAPLMMQIGGVRNDQLSNFSYSAPGEVFPGIGNPTAIFNNLTNLFGDGEMTQDTYKVARGKSVIDIVREDLNSLKRLDMSQTDQRKLSDWMDLLHQTSGEVSAQCTEMTASTLGLTTQSTQGQFMPLPEATDLMMNLAVLTATCDQNRVIFMKLPGSTVYEHLGLTIESHGLSHRTGDACMQGACLNGVLEMLHKVDDWYAEKFAHLVGQLDGLGEGDGTMLDNTATVWFQEDSDGNSHNLNNMPILQAGGCGGYFKTGQAVNVDDGSPGLTVGNSEGLCTDPGTSFDFTQVDSTGTASTIANAPINKYFCNLMNAIGVKGGADGFPAVGGTGEVTHFGKYDDTKLFSTNDPQVIKDPGEFSALRANT